MRTERPEPILPARNLDETRAFYQKLGFVSWHGGRTVGVRDLFPRTHRRSLRVIGVAILSTRTSAGDALDFDATTVDPLTVRFGTHGSEAAETHNRGHLEDVDGDGDLDMMLHVRIDQTGLDCLAGTASLTGRTKANQSFAGSDAIYPTGAN